MRERGNEGRDRAPAAADGSIEEMLERFDELAATVDSPEEAERVEAARAEAIEAVDAERVFGRVIRGFDRADAAETLLGAVVFGIPMAVEGGTLEVGAFLATHPVFHAGTVVFGVGIVVGVLFVVGILYVADIQDVRIHEPLLGVVPRRLAGVLAIAALASLAVMTAWGRVDWATPGVALAQVTATAVPMAIGGALGDILPGT